MQSGGGRPQAFGVELTDVELEALATDCLHIKAEGERVDVGGFITLARTLLHMSVQAAESLPGA